MEIFSHITELDGQGYALLPVVLPLATRTVIWSPTSTQISREHEQKRSVLRSRDIIELVEEGHLRVMGRKEWLTDPLSRRNHPWREATWDRDFDGAISDISLQDRDQQSDKQRVILVDPEKGYAWADEQIRHEAQESRTRIEFIKERIKSRQLPPGVLSKVDRCGDETAKVRVVLRDIKNHADAFRMSRCDTTIDGEVWLSCLQGVLGAELSLPTLEPNKFASHQERLLTLLKMLLSIGAPTDLKGLKKILRAKDTELLQEEYGKLINGDYPVANIISGELARYTDQSWVRALVPESIMEKGLTIGGIVSAVATFQLAPCSALSLSFGLLERRYSPLPIRNYKGPRIPFLVAYGKSEPTYKELKEIHRRVREYMSSLAIRPGRVRAEEHPLTGSETLLGAPEVDRVEPPPETKQSPAAHIYAYKLVVKETNKEKNEESEVGRGTCWFVEKDLVVTAFHVVRGRLGTEEGGSHTEENAPGEGRLAAGALRSSPSSRSVPSAQNENHTRTEPKSAVYIIFDRKEHKLELIDKNVVADVAILRAPALSAPLIMSLSEQLPESKEPWSAPGYADFNSGQCTVLTGTVTACIGERSVEKIQLSLDDEYLSTTLQGEMAPVTDLSDEEPARGIEPKAAAPRKDPFADRTFHLVLNAIGYEGASGSPILSRGEVIGVFLGGVDKVRGILHAAPVGVVRELVKRYRDGAKGVRDGDDAGGSTRTG